MMEREKVKLKRSGAVVIGGRGAKLRRHKPTDPDFDTFLDFTDNPLDGVETNQNDIQESADQEVSAVAQEIARNRKAYEDHFRVSGDPDFYICVVFQSHDQKDEFLRNGKFEDLGERFINGLEFSRRIGVKVNEIELEPIKMRGNPKKYRKEVIV